MNFLPAFPMVSAHCSSSSTTFLSLSKFLNNFGISSAQSVGFCSTTLSAASQSRSTSSIKHLPSVEDHSFALEKASVQAPPFPMVDRGSSLGWLKKKGPLISRGPRYACTLVLLTGVVDELPRSDERQTFGCYRPQSVGAGQRRPDTRSQPLASQIAPPVIGFTA